ncbi:MAG: MFS transporter [Acidobacteriota bacterium]
MSVSNIPGLLRRNPNLRALWMGQIVSQLGDWFNAIALYSLLFQLTGTATSVALVIVLQLLPASFVTPFVGMVIDRFDRRSIMITADIVRGVAILGLLLVRTPGTVWIAYVVLIVAVSATGFFEPAKSATIPSVVAREDLVTANALSTGTWSVMLAVGASIGGLVAAAFGRNVTFVLNSASFFISAFMIAKIRIPPRTATSGGGGFAPFIEGFAYLRAHREIASIALIKAGWSTVGGALLILTVLGQKVFLFHGSGDAGTGVLYAARGVGALAGSWLVTHLAMKSSARLIRLIAPAYFIAGAFYALIGVAPTIWVAAALVIGAHICGSVLWVASNVMLQLNVRDTFRGRVFSAELAALTIIQAASSYITARLLDGWHLDPRTLAVGCGLILWVPGTAWLIRATRQRGKAAECQ